MAELNRPGVLSLEMSLSCNQKCIHCYNNSGPEMGSPTDLTRDQLITVMREGREVGFTELQFAGGEPMLNPSLPELIHAGRELGYKDIEVYSNLSILPPKVLRALVECKAKAATSFYSEKPEVHAKIVGGDNYQKNWHSTVANIGKLLESKVPLRVGLIVMEENRDRVPQTIEYLKSIGIKEIGMTPVRGVGRAEATHPVSDPREGLCGNCCYGSLTIGAQGNVYPCQMAQAFSIGNVKDESLAEIAKSDNVRELRQNLFDYFVRTRGRAGTAGKHYQQEVEVGCCIMTCSPVTSPSCGPKADFRPKETTEVASCCIVCGPAGDAQSLEKIAQYDKTGCGPDLKTFTGGDVKDCCIMTDKCGPTNPCAPRSDDRPTVVEVGCCIESPTPCAPRSDVKPISIEACCVEKPCSSPKGGVAAEMSDKKYS